MKRLIFILVVGVLGATLFSCSPSELEVVSPINATVGEDGSIEDEEDGSGNREGDTVGEDGSIEDEEDGSGNREGDTVGEDGSIEDEEDGSGK